MGDFEKESTVPPSTYPDFATFTSSFATGDVLLNLDLTCYYQMKKALSLFFKERRLVPHHVIPLRLRPFLWNWMVLKLKSSQFYASKPFRTRKSHWQTKLVNKEAYFLSVFLCTGLLYSVTSRTKNGESCWVYLSASFAAGEEWIEGWSSLVLFDPPILTELLLERKSAYWHPLLLR